VENTIASLSMGLNKARRKQLSTKSTTIGSNHVLWFSIYPYKPQLEKLETLASVRRSGDGGAFFLTSTAFYRTH
jgi:hypothetical protein